MEQFLHELQSAVPPVKRASVAAIAIAAAVLFLLTGFGIFTILRIGADSGKTPIVSNPSLQSPSDIPSEEAATDTPSEKPTSSVPSEESPSEEHTHTWNEATCTTPKTCAVCGETSGEALGHRWEDATSLTPKKCSVCGETDGYSLGYPLALCQLAENSQDATIGSWKDISGNSHANAIQFWVANRPGWTNTEHIAFDLGGQYDLLEITVCLEAKSEKGASFSISIYADGQLKYVSSLIDEANPLEKSINITNVTNLRIICTTDNSASTYGIVDAVVKSGK